MKMNMKNKIGIIIAMFVLITFSACEDLITDKPQSKLTQTNFYTNQASIGYGIMGCYSGMAIVMMDEWKFTENRSDNSCVIYTGTGSADRVDYCDIKFFRTPPSQPKLLSFWYGFWQNIGNINAVLPAVAKGTPYMTNETLRAQYEGELLFIRSYHYFSLTSFWGDMFKITKTVDKDSAKTLTRRPVAEIYHDIIIPDLKKAALQLPSTYSSNDLGRVTKWAAKGILAKAYMTLGGSLNLDSAMVLLNEIVANSPHGLLTDSVAIGSKKIHPYPGIFDIANEMNKEIIFAVRYKGGTSGIGSPFWGTFAPDGSQNQVLAVGTPSGNNNPTPDIQSLFATDGTARKNACFLMYLKSKTLYAYVSKFVDPTISQAFQGENDWPVLRFADIVLMRAEILAQGATPDLARTEINKIRARAGATLITTVFASKADALDAVYKERRLEFAFEDQRWFDILRMNNSYGDPNKAISVLIKEVFSTDISTYAAYKPIIPPSQEFFKTSRLLLPIPQQEIDTYKAGNTLTLPQNADY
jgi:starch-binding outer membrane protein, SusD/RagB family